MPIESNVNWAYVKEKIVKAIQKIECTGKEKIAVDKLRVSTAIVFARVMKIYPNGDTNTYYKSYERRMLENYDKLQSQIEKCY